MFSIWLRLWLIASQSKTIIIFNLNYCDIKSKVSIEVLSCFILSKLFPTQSKWLIRVSWSSFKILMSFDEYKGCLSIEIAFHVITEPLSCCLLNIFIDSFQKLCQQHTGLSIFFFFFVTTEYDIQLFISKWHVLFSIL